MRRWEKWALLWGLILVLAGMMLFAVLAAGYRFDFESFAAALSDESYQKNTYQPGNHFKRIEISEISADVHILPAEDSNCSVTCDESGEISYEVQVRDDTLYITRRETEKPAIGWINVNLELPKVTVRLPAGCEEIQIETVSGDVRLRRLEIGSAEITSVSGDIRLDSLQLDGAQLQTVSGDILLQNSDAGKKIAVDTCSGDVKMENCDAELFHIVTASGDVSAALKTGKVFSAETVSGDVHLPEDVSGSGVFRAQTVSGDIAAGVK